MGLTGWALVASLPQIPVLVAPWFRPLAHAPLALGALRFALAFAVLLVPSTAMGATLPLLVKALHRHRPGFGNALGWLYGWNTLGAMAGTVAAEEWLVPSYGIRGSPVAAASCSGLAVLACVTLLSRLDRSLGTDTTRVGPGRPPGPTRDPRRARILAAALLSGRVLLALEVVWFRFMQLFAASQTRTFAITLMVVLLGIGGGDLLAGLWLRL